MYLLSLSDTDINTVYWLPQWGGVLATRWRQGDRWTNEWRIKPHSHLETRHTSRGVRVCWGTARGTASGDCDPNPRAPARTPAGRCRRPAAATTASPARSRRPDTRPDTSRTNRRHRKRLKRTKSLQTRPGKPRRRSTTPCLFVTSDDEARRRGRGFRFKGAAHFNRSRTTQVTTHTKINK